MNTARALAVVILVVVCASFALAQQVPQPSDARTAPQAEKRAVPVPAVPGAPASGGLVVFIDPATGKIRQPDAAEIGRLVSPLGEREPLVYGPPLTLNLPGGGVAIQLDRSFESYMVMTKAPDGKLVMKCVTGERQAQEAVSGGLKAAPKRGERGAADVP